MLVNNLQKEKIEIYNYVMSIRDISTREGLKVFMSACDELHMATPQDTLELRINTPGGALFAGYELLCIMNETFRGRTTAIISAEAMSMGALIFLTAGTRIVNPYSSLMLHEYSGGFWGKRTEVDDYFEHTNQFSDKHVHSLVKPFLTKAEYKKFTNGRELYFSAEQLLENGMATHIIVDGSLLSAKEYLEVK